MSCMLVLSQKLAIWHFPFFFFNSEHCKNHVKLIMWNLRGYGSSSEETYFILWRSVKEWGLFGAAEVGYFWGRFILQLLSFPTKGTGFSRFFKNIGVQLPASAFKGESVFPKVL